MYRSFPFDPATPDSAAEGDRRWTETDRVDPSDP